jgi:hypothetical protein
MARPGFAGLTKIEYFRHLIQNTSLRNHDLWKDNLIRRGIGQFFDI